MSGGSGDETSSETSSSDTDTSCEVNDEECDETYEGQTNSSDQPHGRGTLYFDAKKQDRFHGHFTNGVKEGRGCFYFADGSSLSGMFKGDLLEGCGLYMYEDGSLMVGTYSDGDLNGSSEEYDCDGKITFKGSYKDNIRCGVCHFYLQYDGHVFGVVNKDGKLTGKDVVYAYPGYTEEEMFLKGTFQDGDMVSAFNATYDGIGSRDNPHSYNKHLKSSEYFKDISNDLVISSHPMLGDIYEEKRVTVKISLINNAGEGLFSLISAGPGEVMSFYNGVRVSHQIVDSRDWLYNDNTISLDKDIVIDVPKEWSSLEHYTSSLGHKANHSFEPNCKYDRFDHPRFGNIKCIRTIVPVNAGDELTVAYGYDHTKLDTEAPQWYREEMERWNNNKLEKYRNCGL